MKLDDCNQIRNQFKRYASLRTYYVGLLTNKYVSEVVSMVIKNIVFGVIAAMVIFMLSLAFVFWYGEEVGKIYHGFLILSLIYIIIGLIIYLIRNHLFTNPLIRKIHRKDLIEKEKALSKLPVPRNLGDLNQQIEIVKFQIEETENALQERLDDLTETIVPLINLGKRLGNIFSMATTVYKITLEAVQNFIDRMAQKKSAEADYDESEEC